MSKLVGRRTLFCSHGLWTSGKTPRSQEPVLFLDDETPRSGFTYAYDALISMYDCSVQHVSCAHRFTGKEHDWESGLDNFGARYDSSSLGRFMTADPLAGHTEDPQTLNRYAYVRNNPLNLTDPTGLDFYLQCNNKDHKDCVQVQIDPKNDKSKQWVQVVLQERALLFFRESGFVVAGRTSRSSDSSGQGSF